MKRKMGILIAAVVCVVMASVVIIVVASDLGNDGEVGLCADTSVCTTAIPEIDSNIFPDKLLGESAEGTVIEDEYIRLLMDELCELEAEEERLRGLIASSGEDACPELCYMKNADFLMLVISCKTRLEKELIVKLDEKLSDHGEEYSASYASMLKDARVNTAVQYETDKLSYRTLVSEKEAFMISLGDGVDKYEPNSKDAITAEDVLEVEFEDYINMIRMQEHVVPSGDGFIRPIPVGEGSVTSPFGEREVNGAQGYHGAADISCAWGTPVYASCDGEVIRAEWHPSYGHYIIIDHGGNVSTLYAHCSELSVSAGQTVEKGQLIGYVGNSGCAFGAHLHFEYRISGQRVDPELYVTL